MSRKTQEWTAKDGRDEGKLFFITEMPARQAHRWATRALFAAINGGATIPEDVAEMGMAGLAALGVKALAGMKAEQAEPLMDELLTCVQIMPDPMNPQIKRKLMEEASDIEEAITYFKLQKEVLALHLDFFTAGAK